jgi:hypothetical protein
MNYLVDPQTLIFNAHRVNGFTKMVGDEQIPQWDLLEIATEVAEEWTEDWDEDQGFGSSDMTYMISKLETKFTPSLSIVEYSEAGHHEKVLRMEQGI